MRLSPRRLLALPGPARRLLLEATLDLWLARLALRVLPFRRLTWFFERPARRPELAGPARLREKQRVMRALAAAAYGLVEEDGCFPRAIAAQALLRRRGISTVLYYGAATSRGGELRAHVWVQDGPHIVVGHLVGGDYLVLARYPSTIQPEAGPGLNSTKTFNIMEELIGPR